MGEIGGAIHRREARETRIATIEAGETVMIAIPIEIETRDIVLALETEIEIAIEIGMESETAGEMKDGTGKGTETETVEEVAKGVMDGIIVALGVEREEVIGTETEIEKIGNAIVKMTVRNGIGIEIRGVRVQHENFLPPSKLLDHRRAREHLITTMF
jgi:hypothetical protein